MVKSVDHQVDYQSCLKLDFLLFVSLDLLLLHISKTKMVRNISSISNSLYLHHNLYIIFQIDFKFEGLCAATFAPMKENGYVLLCTF